jgi:hypothetical protein
MGNNCKTPDLIVTEIAGNIDLVLIHTFLIFQNCSLFLDKFQDRNQITVLFLEIVTLTFDPQTSSS